MDELIKSLSTLHKYLKDAWLIPCDNKKKPAGGHIGSGERHITPDGLRHALKSRKLELPCWQDWRKKDVKIMKNIYDSISGYKLLTGKPVTYRCQQVVLVALDLDGETAEDDLREILGDEELPKTVTWSSGLPGRRTSIFYLPEAKSKEVESKSKFGSLEVIAGWPGVVLPPSVHPETGKYSFLDGCSFEEAPIAELPVKMLQKIAKAPKFRSLDEIPIPVTEPVPLLSCCNKETRQLVISGVPEGSGHNDAAVKIAMELVAVQRYLDSIRQSYDYGADDHFRDFLVASEVAETPRSLERLEWAHKKNYIQPSCKEEGVNNCIRGWYWKNVLKQSGSIVKQGKLTLVTPEVREIIWERLESIYSENTSLIEQESNLSQVAEEYGVEQKQVDRLYRKLSQQLQYETEDDLLKSDFLDFIKIKSTRLDIRDVLPLPLAEDLINNARSKYHPVRVLSYLWPAVGTLVGAKVKVWANKPSNWSSDLVFYCVDIGRKGSGKTPAGSDTLKHIFEKDKQARAEWEGQQRTLEGLRTAWEDMASRERDEFANDPTINPALYEQQMSPERKYKFDSPTVPAVVKYLGLQPKWHSGLLYNDELASLFAGFNQFTKGGNDRQFWLEFFNGRSWKTLERVTDTPGTCRRLNGQLMQVCGGMQLDAFKKYLSLSTAQDGLTDRFLISNPPEIPPPKGLAKSGTGSSLILEYVYRCLESIDLMLDPDGEPQPAYMDWNPDAMEYWEQCYVSLTSLSYELRTQNPDFSGYCSKLITYFPRIAGAIALIWQTVDLQDGERLIPQNIPLHVAEKTWKVIQYYACQYLAVQHVGDTEKEPILSEIWRIIEAEGSITPRTVVQRFGSRKIGNRKIDTKTAMGLLHQLHDSGFGQIEGVRTSFKLVYKAPAEELIRHSIFQLKPKPSKPSVDDVVSIYNCQEIPDNTRGVVSEIRPDGIYVVVTEKQTVVETVSDNLYIQE